MVGAEISTPSTKDGTKKSVSFKPFHLDWFRRVIQQQLDGLKNRHETLVELFLQFFNLFLKVSMCHQPFPQFGESTHDLNVHMNRTFAIEDRTQHGNTIFRKNIRQITATTVPQT